MSDPLRDRAIDEAYRQHIADVADSRLVPNDLGRLREFFNTDQVFTDEEGTDLFVIPAELGFALVARLADAEKALRLGRELFQHEPYRGLNGKIVCSQCEGSGMTPGQNHDDPRWMPCLLCHGDGLTAKAREVRAAFDAAAAAPPPADQEEA